MGASWVPGKGLVHHLPPVISVLEATRGGVSSPFDRRVNQGTEVKLWAQALSSLEGRAKSPPQMAPSKLQLKLPPGCHSGCRGREGLCQPEDATLSINICPFPAQFSCCSPSSFQLIGNENFCFC